MFHSILDGFDAKRNCIERAREIWELGMESKKKGFAFGTLFHPFLRIPHIRMFITIPKEHRQIGYIHSIIIRKSNGTNAPGLSCDHLMLVEGGPVSTSHAADSSRWAHILRMGLYLRCRTYFSPATMPRPVPSSSGMGRVYGGRAERKPDRVGLDSAHRHGIVGRGRRLEENKWILAESSGPTGGCVWRDCFLPGKTKSSGRIATWGSRLLIICGEEVISPPPPRRTGTGATLSTEHPDDDGLGLSTRRGPNEDASSPVAGSVSRCGFLVAIDSF